MCCVCVQRSMPEIIDYCKYIVLLSDTHACYYSHCIYILHSCSVLLRHALYNALFCFDVPVMASSRDWQFCFWAGRPFAWKIFLQRHFVNGFSSLVIWYCWWWWLADILFVSCVRLQWRETRRHWHTHASRSFVNQFTMNPVRWSAWLVYQTLWVVVVGTRGLTRLHRPVPVCHRHRQCLTSMNPRHSRTVTQLSVSKPPRDILLWNFCFSSEQITFNFISVSILSCISIFLKFHFSVLK